MATTMQEYIKNTPKIVIRNLKNHDKLVEKLVDIYTKNQYHRIILVASGSSYTAAQCAKDFMRKNLEIGVEIINPYTFTNYYSTQINDSDFVLVISQSGGSSNCIDALKAIRNSNQQTYILTTNPKCECADYADQLFDWKCGIETVGFVTQGVVTLIVYLQLFTAHVVSRKNKETQLLNKCIQQINQAMINHKEIQKKTFTFISNNYKELLSMDRVYILGCGSNYGTALEGALKIGETIKVLSVGYELDEFLHGPAIQLNPNYTIFIIDSNDHTSSYARHVYHSLQTITNRSYYITSRNDICDKKVISVSQPCEEPFTCLYYLPFLELIAAEISTDLNSQNSNILYYKMTESLDFRTKKYRKNHKIND